uniref:Uncharacterized protein n=1 Tax=Aegilops tauschii subsp. strangulata TaxID=200361 RepID=A0A453SE48_AEGTS
CGSPPRCCQLHGRRRPATSRISPSLLLGRLAEGNDGSGELRSSRLRSGGPLPEPSRIIRQLFNPIRSCSPTPLAGGSCVFLSPRRRLLPCSGGDPGCCFPVSH